ncbi:hypothetical protein DFJ58DRAFT_726480 [Suillus subalutaceus]|uniref:uncharacterized protein n=1 Tax=Suillus subalutaceus TaxID=48586 RepID=UPI001B87F3CE|nr:uncharacterized protein DFJ58DRAFT_726480 [Suillus subalutaceus]KAG1859022.1 hypothetical protein DFJ58DRAFT_726480 [Suillus subalutaceus]
MLMKRKTSTISTHANLIVIEQVWFDDEEESIYSQPPNIYPINPRNTHQRDVPPRASTDSDAQRSSLDSFSSSPSHSSSVSTQILLNAKTRDLGSGPSTKE